MRKHTDTGTWRPGPLEPRPCLNLGWTQSLSAHTVWMPIRSLHFQTSHANVYFSSVICAESSRRPHELEAASRLCPSLECQLKPPLLSVTLLSLCWLQSFSFFSQVEQLYITVRTVGSFHTVNRSQDEFSLIISALWNPLHCFLYQHPPSVG